MKLTLVSVSCSWKSVSFFMMLPVVNGKTVIDRKTFNSILEFEHFPMGRGITISIGG